MSSEHNPRISIGIPVYNGENFIAAALQSILNQDFSDIEIIISDNASTDNTPTILKEYAKHILTMIRRTKAKCYPSHNDGCRMTASVYNR